jgi:hypothetical protein
VIRLLDRRSLLLAAARLLIYKLLVTWERPLTEGFGK